MNNNNGTTVVRIKFWAIVVLAASIIGSLCVGYARHDTILASHSVEIRAINERQDRQDQHMKESLKRIEDKLDRLIESRGSF